MENQKTHWKKAFKSDYLSSSDIDGKDLVLIIKCVKYQECVTQSGKKFCNVAHFTSNEFKPMILNVTNSKVIKKFANNAVHIDDWNNIPVQIYVDSKVRFGNDTVEGLRIREVQPKLNKRELLPNTKEWENAVDFIKNRKGTMALVKGNYSISIENETKLTNESKV